MPLFLAIRAEAEKIQAMTCDLKACFRNQFLGHPLRTLQIRVNDFLAFGADEGKVGCRHIGCCPPETRVPAPPSVL